MPSKEQEDERSVATDDDSSNAAGQLKKIIFATATSQAIVLRLRRKESPDSTEQCTGEEPGVPVQTGITDSATENDLNPYPSPQVEKGRMEG